MQKRTLLFRFIAAPMIIFLSSCAATVKPDNEKQPYLVGGTLSLPQTQTNKELRDLPDPAGPLEAAVYSFNDLTGQKKTPPNSSTFSTAVTQGAETILIKALLDSKWFLPKERKGIQNILTERKILQGVIDESNNGRTTRINALQAAKVIFEGGIISYDSNIRTGGFGAKYLGLGASTRYREDLISINLRVINVLDGSILHSVTSHKTIYSKLRDTSLFAYVAYDQILEIEGGYSYNESIQLGLTEAIESAVIQMIADGTLLSVWGLKNKDDLTHPTFSKHADPVLWAEYVQENELIEDAETEQQTSSSTAPSADVAVVPANDGFVAVPTVKLARNDAFARKVSMAAGNKPHRHPVAHPF